MLTGTMAVFYTWAGHLGVAFYIGSYAALQAGLIRGNGYLYATLNLIAASLVLISLSAAYNQSAAVIQIFWILISIIGLGRLYLLNHRIRFTDEERHMLDDVFPEMPHSMARRVLNRGVWSDVAPGEQLTVEGTAVKHLRYILSGKAEVIAGGTTIAELERGLVGEMNVLESGPASATVRISSPARIFTISGDNLRTVSRSDAELRLQLEQWMRDAIRKKLIATNKKLSQEACP